MSHETQEQLSDRIAEAVQQVDIGGRYAHYKNHDIYKVVNLALREDDIEPCVVYQAEYGERVIFTRPIASWLEEVDLDGKKVRRFEKVEEESFEDDSNKVKNSLLIQGGKLADIIDQEERQSEEHTAYLGYLKDFLINSGCLCDDNIQAACNNAVLLAMIGTRTLLEDTINCYYLKSRPDDAARTATAVDWFATSNNPEAYKNKIDGKSVAKRADESGDDDIKALHDGEYANFCNYTHSTAHRSILNIPAHRQLAARKSTVASIKAYANILTCIAEIIGQSVDDAVIQDVQSYFSKYRDSVMEATLDV